MPGSLRRTVEQGRKWGPFIETYKLESLIFRKTNRIVFVGIFKVWPNASPFYWIGREVWTAYIWKESGVFWLGNAKCNFSSARESLGSDPTWLGLVHIALIDRARRFELRWILTSLTQRMTHSLARTQSTDISLSGGSEASNLYVHYFFLRAVPHLHGRTWHISITNEAAPREQMGLWGTGKEKENIWDLYSVLFPQWRELTFCVNSFTLNSEEGERSE